MGNRKPREENRPAAAGSEEVSDSASAKKRSKKARKGPQAHAEGAHGPKTEQKIVEQLESGPARENEFEAELRSHRARPAEQPLLEHRAQHDDADESSKKNRLDKYLEDHHIPKKGYDVPGGH